MFIRKVCLLITSVTLVGSFSPANRVQTKLSPLLASKDTESNELASDRRSFVSSILAGGVVLSSPFSAFADDGEEESFASIAARASKLSVGVAYKNPATVSTTGDGRTAYEFTLPVKGSDVPFKELVNQEYSEEGSAKVKAILVINMKQDDPVARKDIPELISLAAKYVTF